MRSLATIRSRVERLAAVGLPGAVPMFVSWGHAYKRCPACAVDLAALEHAAAEVEVRADLAHGARSGDLLGRRVDDVPTLPRGAAVGPSR